MDAVTEKKEGKETEVPQFMNTNSDSIVASAQSGASGPEKRCEDGTDKKEVLASLNTDIHQLPKVYADKLQRLLSMEAEASQVLDTLVAENSEMLNRCKDLEARIQLANKKRLMDESAQAELVDELSSSEKLLETKKTQLESLELANLTLRVDLAQGLANKSSDLAQTHLELKKECCVPNSTGTATLLLRSEELEKEVELLESQIAAYKMAFNLENMEELGLGDSEEE